VGLEALADHTAVAAAEGARFEIHQPEAEVALVAMVELVRLLFIVGDKKCLSQINHRRLITKPLFQK